MNNTRTAKCPIVSIGTGTVHIIDTNTTISVHLKEAQKLQKYTKMSRYSLRVCILLHPPHYVRSDCLGLRSAHPWTITSLNVET